MSSLTAILAGFPAAETATKPAHGWFAHMIQLWLEHNARVLEMGGEPL